MKHNLTKLFTAPIAAVVMGGFALSASANTEAKSQTAVDRILTNDSATWFVDSRGGKGGGKGCAKRGGRGGSHGKPGASRGGRGGGHGKSGANRGGGHGKLGADRGGPQREPGGPSRGAQRGGPQRGPGGPSRGGGGRDRGGR